MLCPCQTCSAGCMAICAAKAYLVAGSIVAALAVAVLWLWPWKRKGAR